MKWTQSSSDFEITLELHSDAFIATPRPSQRRWMVRRAVEELVRDLEHIHAVAPSLVPGAVQRPWEGTLEHGDTAFHDGKLQIQGQTVMEDWQPVLMNALAEAVARPDGRVLEIGFGLGLSATRIQEIGVRSHTVVECNPGVAQRFDAWRQGYPDRDIRLLLGRWQDVVTEHETYDGILFDTFPVTYEEYAKTVFGDVTYAEHFFDTAQRLLIPGGAFTYFTSERDSLSRAHQRLLLDRFSSVSLRIVRGLDPAPKSTIWWAKQMLVVTATR
jgi:hypothetical protein